MDDDNDWINWVPELGEELELARALAREAEAAETIKNDR